jgi:hypothetical protein
MSVQLIELLGLRAIYGNDKNAINRHSTRTYIIYINGKDSGWGLELDRILDQSPIGFVVTEFEYADTRGISKSSNPLPKKINSPVIDLCRTWAQIEKVLADIVLCLEKTPLKLDETIELSRSEPALDYYHMYGEPYPKAWTNC